MTPDPQQSAFTRSLRRLQAALWRRRVWHGLVRSAWLVLLVPTVVKAGYRWLDWQVHWRYWGPLALLLGLASVLWSLRPVRAVSLVRRLDERLQLQTRLMTALEVSQVTTPNPDHNTVVPRLLNEAVNIAIHLRRRVGSFGVGFWLETQTFFALVALLAGMLILDGLDPRLPATPTLSLPVAWQEPTADQIIPPNPTLYPPPFAPSLPVQAPNEGLTQEELAAIGDALRDEAVTRAIAEAIDAGDLPGAADGLRRLADQLGDLSEQARNGLGDALDAAAEALGEDASEVSETLETAAEAVRAGDLPEAAENLEALADALDRLEEGTLARAQSSAASADAQDPPEPGGEQPGGGDPRDGAGDGGEGGADQPTEVERLAVEGEPLELESEPQTDERVLQPADLDANPDGDRAQDSPFARQPANAAVGDLGPDLLAYPWDRKEVIRRYFTPESERQ